MTGGVDALTAGEQVGNPKYLQPWFVVNLLSILKASAVPWLGPPVVPFYPFLGGGFPH